MNAPWRAEQFRVPAPMGKKRCAVEGCDRLLPSHDKHARCQLCRNMQPHLVEKYTFACEVCGTEKVGDRQGLKACSDEHARVLQIRNRRGRR